jgi:hypothetical protein
MPYRALTLAPDHLRRHTYRTIAESGDDALAQAGHVGVALRASTAAEPVEENWPRQSPTAVKCWTRLWLSRSAYIAAIATSMVPGETCRSQVAVTTE